MKTLSLLTLFVCLSSTPSGAGEAFEVKSAPQQLNLVELFSSEGCSSCPPADRWLGSLKDQKGLFTHFVPVAFHVDYWNHIGWVDPYSRKEFSTRQRRYAREWNSRTVYTPGFVLNGNEWRRRGLKTLQKKGLAKGVLTVKSFKPAQGEFIVHFQPLTRLPKQIRIHGVIQGSGIKTRVPSGENGGKTLGHDFIALGYDRATLTKNKKGAYTGVIKVKDRFKSLKAKRSASFWLTLVDGTEPIQSAGSYF